MAVMKLTQELFAPFVGGYVKIQNSTRNHILWGKIRSIAVDFHGSEFTITFVWLARGVGLLCEVRDWTEIPDRGYQASGRKLFWSSMRQSPDAKGCWRMAFYNEEKNDLVVFYKPEGEKLIQERPSVQSFELLSI